jgi:glucose/arabinose dehydrogenase
MQKSKLFFVSLAVGLTALFGFFSFFHHPLPVANAAVPANFEDSLITTGVSFPTDLVFAPDGRLFITSQQGRMFIYNNGSLLTPAALDLNLQPNKICSNNERGLLGITVDPDFASNQYIYVYYTHNKYANSSCPGNAPTSPVNRVSRFTMQGNTVLTTTELVLVDHIPSPAGNHNAGDLGFGADGKLYISVGDGGCAVRTIGNSLGVGDGSRCAGNNDIARLRNVIVGKMLRINKDGTIPADNPYTGAGTRRCGDPTNVSMTLTETVAAGNCQETYAWGLRNPFRIAFKPGTSEFYINDVGQNAREEINESKFNADYGWNVREGLCDNDALDCDSPLPAGMTNPIFDYRHFLNSGPFKDCGSITGGAVVPVGAWPAAFDNDYLFTDSNCGKIFRMNLNASSGTTVTEFVTGTASSIVSMQFGPDGALYYTAYFPTAQVRKLRYTGQANRNPVAEFTVTPSNSPTVPFTANFDASASSDPDTGDTLTYVWNFGDGSPTVTRTSPTITRSYSVLGIYTATLVVRDNRNGVSAPVTRRVIAGNNVPQPQIILPRPDDKFVVDQVITAEGRATDLEDGTIPGNKLDWEILRRHENHYHPWAAGTGSVITFTAPPPEEIAAVNTSWLEFRLRATDSVGASKEITQIMLPKKVNVVVDSTPSGAVVRINGTNYNTPVTFQSWVGYSLDISTTNQTVTGQNWTFIGWSNGQPAAQVVTTPNGNLFLNANFNAGGACPNALNVTKTNDDGSCGTLRYAVQNAGVGATIQLAAGTTITLTGSLNVTRSVTIQGNSCGSPATIVGASVGGEGLTFNAGSQSGVPLNGFRLSNLVVRSFGGREIVSSGGNLQLSCVRVQS